MTTKKKKAVPAPTPAETQSLVDWNAICWLANGHRGISSNTLFTKVTGLSAACGGDHFDAPSDAWDFARCARLLVVCPQFRPFLHRVRKVNRRWGIVVDNWDILEALLRIEWPALFVNDGKPYAEPEKHPEATYRATKTLFARPVPFHDDYSLAA